MSILGRYRSSFATALAAELNRPVAEVLAEIKPADPKFGDFSFATHPMAKTLKKAPPLIAKELAPKVKAEGLQVSDAAGYVNAKIIPEAFSKAVVEAVRAAGNTWGHGDSGKGKTVAIDYSSPNIAKPIAFHHIRSTAIGHAIANLHRAQGWKVEGIDYLGDWGKQFGLVAVGFQEWGDPKRKHEVAHLVDVYVKANQKAESDPSFDERARAFFRRMEDGDPEALAFWKECRETSLKDFEKVYARLGIVFEHIDGESRYQGKMDAVIDEISRTVGTEQSQGALIVKMEYAEGEPPVLLKKNDGSTLYATRDLAAAIDRFERFHFDRSLYVVAADQSLHFKQFFRVLTLMGRKFAPNLQHVSFGRVHGMSTRKGTLHLLSDILDESKRLALEKVKANIAEGRMHTDDPEGLADAIGVGAIVFGDLKNRRVTDYEFNWDDVLSFEGHTGPYLQYAHARCCSILQKGGGLGTFDAALLALPEEQQLIRDLARFEDLAFDATEQSEPSLVARWLLDLAADFSRWYTLGNQDHTKRVLVEGNEPLKAARLALTDAVRCGLAAGLTLLGLKTPERM